MGYQKSASSFIRPENLLHLALLPGKQSIETSRFDGAGAIGGIVGGQIVVLFLSHLFSISFRSIGGDFLKYT
jgi:hypothetical protein